MALTHKLLLVAGLGLGTRVAVGGWAVVTIVNPPAYLEAGKTYQLEYMVRQHGRDPLAGLQGTVQIQPTGTAPASLITVSTTPGNRKGSYLASFRVPEGERLSLKIQTGFSGGGWGDLSVTGIPVIGSSQARPQLSPVERGRQLFVMKGCGMCHVNLGIPEYGEQNRVMNGVAPELTGRQLEARYVRQRLTNPSSLPKIGDGPVRMPNLELAPAEVDALVAMLTAK
jgi:hypothetical protein